MDPENLLAEPELPPEPPELAPEPGEGGLELSVPVPDKGELAFREVLGSAGKSGLSPLGSEPVREQWYSSKGFLGVSCLTFGVIFGWMLAFTLTPQSKPAVVAQHSTENHPWNTGKPVAQASGSVQKGTHSAGGQVPGGVPEVVPFGPPKPPYGSLKHRPGANPDQHKPGQGTPPSGPGASTPMNPFDGGSIPVPMTGDLTPMPTLPTAQGTGTDPGIVGGLTKLVRATVSGDEVELIPKLQSIARSQSGRMKSFDHMSVKGEKESRGALLLVPSSKLPATIRAVNEAGMHAEVVVAGTSAERQQQLLSPFSLRLSELQEEKKKLLVEWQEGAQPVKEIEAAMVAEARAVSMLRLGPGSEKYGLVLIMIRE